MMTMGLFGSLIGESVEEKKGRMNWENGEIWEGEGFEGFMYLHNTKFP
jgi:hypothetical protein